MRTYTDRVALRCHLHAQKLEAIEFCLFLINTAVRNNEPDINKIARTAFRAYGRILTMERFINSLGCGTKMKNMQNWDYGVDHMRYAEMLDRLDDDVKEIINEKGITL